MSDLVVLHEVPDSKHGKAPEDRSIEERIRLGVAIVDKPAGPTSHQVSAWVRDMFGVPKAGHSGTLDPRVTGVLPVALADATRAVEAVLAGDKEYVGVMQLHQDVDERRVRSMMGRFVGEIFQVPPIRSAVKREQRTRHVYELEPLEVEGRNVLFRARCESGTYTRPPSADVGSNRHREVRRRRGYGPGAHVPGDLPATLEVTGCRLTPGVSTSNVRRPRIACGRCTSGCRRFGRRSPRGSRWPSSSVGRARCEIGSSPFGCLRGSPRSCSWSSCSAS